MDELMTQQQVADRFQVSTRTVRRWISEGKIHAYRIGKRCIRIDSHSLDFLYDGINWSRD
jgi:excisionase family DNA binding protein